MVVVAVPAGPGGAPGLLHPPAPAIMVVVTAMASLILPVTLALAMVGAVGAVVVTGEAGACRRKERGWGMENRCKQGRAARCEKMAGIAVLSSPPANEVVLAWCRQVAAPLG